MNTFDYYDEIPLDRRIEDEFNRYSNILFWQKVSGYSEGERKCVVGYSRDGHTIHFCNQWDAYTYLLNFFFREKCSEGNPPSDRELLLDFKKHCAASRENILELNVESLFIFANKHDKLEIKGGSIYGMITIALMPNQLIVRHILQVPSLRNHFIKNPMFKI